MPAADTATAQASNRSVAQFASLAIALLGLAISVYLTIEHYSTAVTFACPETATINCQKVTTSTYSHVGPVPVAVLGLAFFIGMTVLCTPTSWRWRTLDPLRLLGAGVGVLVALYLVYVELFEVDAICLWCTGVHLCSLALFGAVLYAVVFRTDGPAARS